MPPYFLAALLRKATHVTHARSRSSGKFTKINCHVTYMNCRFVHWLSINGCGIFCPVASFYLLSIYFSSEVRVEGLETLDYFDNLKNKERFTEQGDAITFDGELDRVYLSTPTKIAIIDHEKKRTFVLKKEGLPDAVVWNPWDRTSRTIADLGDDDYKRMVCVEAAAVEKPIVLKPGEEWKGRQEITAVPSSYCSGQLDPQKVLNG
ncbi:hypothetical protein L7F22_058156 [Adiantum nelumboides]|nr:hypothetical protein [Adiantum nelumboides]